MTLKKYIRLKYRILRTLFIEKLHFFVPWDFRGIYSIKLNLFSKLLPIIGNGFCVSLAALMIPITSKIKTSKPKMLLRVNPT